MAKKVINYHFVLNLLFLLIEVSSSSLDVKTCSNGSIFYKMDRTGRRRLQRECCPGYRKQVTGVVSIQCIPICIPACKNGICESPGVCTCNIGYKPDPEQKNNCIPHCSDGCIHGTCVSPEQCYCDHGYEYDLDVERCQPVCTEPCHNGTCVSPENCQCYPGYRKSEANECEPYCSVGCDHGHCIGPDICACDPGWSYYRNFEFNPGGCKPICSSCEGVCIAPEVCIETGTELNTVETSTSTDDELAINTDWPDDVITSTNVWDDDVMDDKHKHDKMESDQRNIFVIIGSLLFIACLILLAILILKWTKLLVYMLGRSYVVEDKDITDHNMAYLGG